MLFHCFATLYKSLSVGRNFDGLRQSAALTATRHSRGTVTHKLIRAKSNPILAANSDPPLPNVIRMGANVLGKHFILMIYNS